MTVTGESASGAAGTPRVIAESNRLIREGLVHVASDLLEEAMESSSADVQIIRALAQVRMLQKRAAEAVPLLQRALRILQGREKLEDFSFDAVPVVPARPSPLISSTPIGAVVGVETHTALDPHVPESDYDYAARVEREILALRDVGLDLQDPSTGDGASAPDLQDYMQSSSAAEYEPTQTEIEEIWEFHNEALEIFREVYRDQDEPLDGPIDVDKLIASFDDESSEEFAGEEGFDTEEPSAPQSRDYDPSLDDFGAAHEGEAASREELQRVPSRITREQRARQIAQELADEYAWDRAGVDLLTSIFVKHWWSSAQAAMRRLIEAGITQKELTLADQVREVWISYQEFAEHIDHWGNKTQRYRTLPWTTTLDLVRAYTGYPDVEEIEGYLYDGYVTWASLDHLHLRFPAYYVFLRHILDNHEDGEMPPPSMIYG